MAKSIKKNYFYNILLNVSKVIFPLITAPYVSRVLEPDGIGLFNFANTYATYFSLFAALGIPIYGIREIAKIKDKTIDEKNKFVSEIISISIVATIICTSFFVATLFFIPQLNDNFVVFVIAAIVLYITPFRIDWFFSGLEDFGYITFRSLVIKTASVLLLFLLVKNKEDLVVYVALNALSLVANEIWNYCILYKLGMHPYFTLNGRKHIKPLLLLFLSSVAVSIYTVLDTIMLGFITNYDEVGYYNSAVHLSKAILPIVTSLSVVALPRIATYYKENNWGKINELMNKSFSLVSFLAFPIAFGLMAIAPVFVPQFFGVSFVGAVAPLQVVSLIIIAIGFNNLLGIQFLASIGCDKQLLLSISSGAVLNCLLNFILIPSWGAVGACASSVCAETLIVIIMIYYVLNKTKLKFRYHDTIVACFFSLTFFFIVKILEMFADGWELIILFGFISSLLYLTSQYLLKNPYAICVFVYINKIIKNSVVILK